MRKYYYVCPRCGRCYKRYIPRRKAKCRFCSTVWKTRKAKGTRSEFSWTATLFMLAAIVAIAFFAGREFGFFLKSSDRIEAHSWENASETSDAVAPWEDAETAEIADAVAPLEETEVSETEATEETEVSTDAEDAAIE